jgi:tetratricopeptide (TPR) repeat protein
MKRRLEPADVLRLAQRLHHQGGDANAAEAERAYRHVLRGDPTCLPALTGLARLHLARGAAGLAWPLLEQATALAPDCATIRNDLGIAALALGRPRDAAAYFADAARLAPDAPGAYINTGQALLALGETEAAAAQFEKAVERGPDSVPALAGLGRAQAAIGRHQDAADTLRRALGLSAADATLHNDFGAALAALARPAEAEAAFRAAIAAKPDFATAYSNLGNTLAAQHRFAEAAACYETAIQLDPNLAEAHGNLGAALLEVRHPEDALPHLDRALELDPSLAETEHARAHTQMMLGDLEAARQNFRRAAALRPERAAYYAGLAASRGLAADDPAFLAMRAMAEDAASLSRATAVALDFALHRCYEAQGDLDAAFFHLARGNRLRREVMPYDEAATMAYFERLKSVFDAALLRRAPPRPATPDLPIFILGMPRSGSTLTEQILASHRAVGVAGEMMFLPHIAEALNRGELALPYPANVVGCAAADFAAAGDNYRALLRARVPTGRQVTDKMPLNFLHIGLIRLMLPGARIIHTRRDAADTCFSNFAQAFTKGLPQTNDLAELGRYHRAYSDLMAHWREVLPEPCMLEVDYETLVADFEPQVRRILAYCGLDWDPACLAFHETKRPVLTASLAQVRRPIYPDSVGRAARYGELLAPLLAALEGRK